MALVNAFGALGLDETLQKIVNYLRVLTSNTSLPDSSGRIRVNVETGTNMTITNQTNQSGYSTAYDQYAQMMVCAQSIRSNIVVS